MFEYDLFSREDDNLLSFDNSKLDLPSCDYIFNSSENFGDAIGNDNKISKMELIANDEKKNDSLEVVEKKENDGEEKNGNNDTGIKENKANKTNNILFNVYPKKENRKYYRDNLKDKIIRSFLNNIYLPLNEEILKIRKKNKSFLNNKLLSKITSFLVFFQKIKLNNLFKLKAKDILYTDEINNKFNSNKKDVPENFKAKKNKYNSNNKMIVKYFSDLKERINEIKDEEIKKCILELNEIVEKSLLDMYKVYISNDNHFENFKTIIDDIIALDKKGENEEYLRKYEEVAKSLLNKISE